MKRHVWTTAWLGFRLWLSRQGSLALLAGALLLAGPAALLLGLPPLALALQTEQEQLHALQQAAGQPAPEVVAPATPLLVQRLQAFQAVLQPVGQSEQALRALFAAANQSHLMLDQAEYKLAYDRKGRFWTYAVQLPVSGSYAAIRAFSEQVLLALPNAALDEIEFRRQDIAQPTLDARLRFTLHLDGPAEEGAR